MLSTNTTMTASTPSVTSINSSRSSGGNLLEREINLLPQTHSARTLSNSGRRRMTKRSWVDEWGSNL